MENAGADPVVEFHLPPAGEKVAEQPSGPGGRSTRGCVRLGGEGLQRSAGLGHRSRPYPGPRHTEGLESCRRIDRMWSTLQPEALGERFFIAEWITLGRNQGGQALRFSATNGAAYGLMHHRC
jgi:hypothetical protein